MRHLKKLWSVLLVLVIFAAVPVMISGCGDDENEQDKVENLLDNVKKDVEDATE